MARTGTVSELVVPAPGRQVGREGRQRRVQVPREEGDGPGSPACPATGRSSCREGTTEEGVPVGQPEAWAERPP